MIVHFSKYHGTGNDFILIDGRERDNSFLDKKLIRRLCERRFGIGSDGLILLEDSAKYDFTMRYFNADGLEGTMCGNGGRCITAFAHRLGLCGLECSFEGIDGLHTSVLLPDDEIRLRLQDVDGIRWMEDGYLVDTGSPHYVRFVEQLDQSDMEMEGRKIRYQRRFGKNGVNVNFVAMDPGSNRISVRTYERGVEAETLSCGTGVTAAAICAYYHDKADIFSYRITTRGGKLNVTFRARHHTQFTDVYLTGKVTHVYDGSVEINR